MKFLLCVLGLVALVACTNAQLVLDSCGDMYCHGDKDGVGSSVPDCPRANVEESGELKMMQLANSVNCYCMCGRTEGMNCTHSDTCMVGYECLLTTGIVAKVTDGDVTHGECHSKCVNMAFKSASSNKNKCNQFQQCKLIDGEPVCLQKKYLCQDNIVGAAYQAERIVNGVSVTETFQSQCQLSEANRKLQSDNVRASLWHHLA